jgi:hypothetical protein
LIIPINFIFWVDLALTESNVGLYEDD